MAHKRFLFVNRRAPYGTGYAAEMLEAVLIAAAFDQAVHLAFLDDGVFQLLRGQQPEAVGQRAFALDFHELVEADIEHIWVEREALTERGLAADDLLIGVTVIDRAELIGLMDGMDVVMSA
jgi:tRNA 2-thiouridine synthesizing protein C